MGQLDPAPIRQLAGTTEAPAKDIKSTPRTYAQAVPCQGLLFFWFSEADNVL